MEVIMDDDLSIPDFLKILQEEKNANRLQSSPPKQIDPTSSTKR
jgi:hypothetical protein